MVSEDNNYVCIREKQVNKHEVDIAELKTRVEYKHERIDELKKSMDDMDKKLDKIDHCLSELKLQSEKHDSRIEMGYWLRVNSCWNSYYGFSICNNNSALIFFIFIKTFIYIIII